MPYTYDAWGNVTTTYHNGGSSTPARFNPFKYRGYYHDSELGFYYLNSRYYDPAIGRFISADGEMAGVNGSLQGGNLFAYCFNNPVNLDDSNGNWPKWLKKVAKAVANFVVNVVDAVCSAIEIQVGTGLGAGVSVDDSVEATFYHDVYVSLDDGKLGTGHEVEAKISMGNLSLGDTYNHWSEKGGQSYWCQNCYSSENYTAFTVMSCPHTEKTTDKISFLGVFKINNENEFVIGAGAEIHIGVGGHAQIGFNVSEFARRLFD